MSVLRSLLNPPHTALSAELRVEKEGASVMPEPESIEMMILRLYDQHRSELLRYGVWMGVAPSGCEDLVQEAFLRLHKHLVLEKPRNNLRAWLFRIIHNLAVSAARSPEHLAVQVSEEEWRQIAASIEDGKPTAEAALLLREHQQHVNERMKLLTPVQLHCLQLRMEGFKYGEIAEILEVAVPTVATNVYRAITKIAEKAS